VQEASTYVTVHSYIPHSKYVRIVNKVINDVRVEIKHLEICCGSLYDINVYTLVGLFNTNVL
jgi:hypothetical protein